MLTLRRRSPRVAKKTPAPIVMNEMSDALHMLSQNEKVGEIFVIGGQALYEQSLTDF